MLVTKEAPTLGSGTGILYRKGHLIQVFIFVSDHLWHYRGTMGLEAYSGKGSNGGVWEWTSTTFDNHEGLVPTQLFTGYSTDFFDTKHQVAVSIFSTLVSSSYSQESVRYSWVPLMQLYLALPVVAQSVISTSTTTLIPGLVLEWCMMFEDLINVTLYAFCVFKIMCIIYYLRENVKTFHELSNKKRHNPKRMFTRKPTTRPIDIRRLKLLSKK